MSEIDGVRALWDGQALRFRSGRPIAAPAWFNAAWPAQALDGELWMGRRTFDRLSVAVCRTSPDDDEWRSVRYMVFDLPDRTVRFNERLRRMRTLLGDAKGHGAWVQAIRQFRAIDTAELKQQLAEVVAAGGRRLGAAPRRCPVAARSQQCATQTQTGAGRRGPGRGAFAGQRSAARTTGRFAGVTARWSAFPFGLWLDRCRKRKAPTGGGLGQLPLTRPYALRPAALCHVLARAAG